MRGVFPTIIGAALLASATITSAAPAPNAKQNVPKPASSVEMVAVQSCEAHKFETIISLTGPDGKPHDSKVRLCGLAGQNDADWIRTLKDAVKKTALNATMPQAAKEQIIAAVNGEIARLSTPKLGLAEGVDIGRLKKPLPPTSEVPLSRDYGALPPLPIASAVPSPNLLSPGSGGSSSLSLTLRCAVAGDESRPGSCYSIDRETVLSVEADQSFPRGIELHFVRHGDERAQLSLPAMGVGQTQRVRIPAEVCVGVLRSKVQIQALLANSPRGAAPTTIGEYDLRC
jgi:hypothetical protein